MADNSRKNFMFIAYLDEDLMFDNFSKLSRAGGQGYYIKHMPEAEEKKIHYHCFLRFDTRVSINKIAKMFNISIGLIEEVISISGNIEYCTHINEPNKIQYQLSDFKFFNYSYSKALENSKNDSELTTLKFVDLYYWLVDNRILDYRYVIDYCLKNKSSNLLKAYHFQIKEVLRENRDSKHIIEEEGEIVLYEI